MIQGGLNLRFVIFRNNIFTKSNSNNSFAAITWSLSLKQVKMKTLGPQCIAALWPTQKWETTGRVINI